MVAYIGATEPEYTEICALLQTISSMTGRTIKASNAGSLQFTGAWLDALKDSIFITTIGWRNVDLWAMNDLGVPIFLFAWNSLYDPWNCDYLLELREKAVEEGNYHRAKGINDILIETDWIARRTVVLGRPKELQLESTSRCNARCIMCEHYYTKNSGCGELSRDMLQSLSSAFPYLREVFMHGLGEPMLYQDLEFFLRYLKKYEVAVSCNSNMSVLPENLLHLMDEVFHGISVSCDSCDTYLFSQIRQGLSLERVIHNIDLLHQKAPHIELRMSVVAMRQNITQIPAIIDFAHEMGIEAVQVAYMVPNPLLENDYDSLHHYPAHTKKYFREAAKKAFDYGIRAVFPNTPESSADDDFMNEREQMEKFPIVSQKPEKCREKLKNVSNDDLKKIRDMQPEEIQGTGYECRGICDYLLEKPYIDCNGDVFLCCINPAYRMGNVQRDGGLEIIWNSENYKKIRKVFYDGRVPNCCMNCQFIINHTLSRIGHVNIDELFYRKYYPGKGVQKFINNISQSGGMEKF